MWPELEVELFYCLVPAKTSTDYVKILRTLMNSSHLLKYNRWYEEGESNIWIITEIINKYQTEEKLKLKQRN